MLDDEAIPFILVGNKSDLGHLRKVSAREGEAKVSNITVLFTVAWGTLRVSDPLTPVSTFSPGAGMGLPLHRNLRQDKGKCRGGVPNTNADDPRSVGLELRYCGGSVPEY